MLNVKTKMTIKKGETDTSQERKLGERKWNNAKRLRSET